MPTSPALAIIGPRRLRQNRTCHYRPMVSRPRIPSGSLSPERLIPPLHQVASSNPCPHTSLSSIWLRQPCRPPRLDDTLPLHLPCFPPPFASFSPLDSILTSVIRLDYLHHLSACTKKRSWKAAPPTLTKSSRPRQLAAANRINYLNYRSQLDAPHQNDCLSFKRRRSVISVTLLCDVRTALPAPDSSLIRHFYGLLRLTHNSHQHHQP